MQLALTRPEALLSQLDRGTVLFFAGACAGAIGKTLTAPFDRLKLLLQTRGGMETGLIGQAARDGGLVKSFLAIGSQEGLLGYWRGNAPQVLRVLPYAAAQLCCYEVLKETLRGDQDQVLPLEKKLLAGALAGMASTLLTYPLDTLRLRMAVDPAARSIPGTLRTVWASGGMSALYRGAGTALLGIAPYMAIELALVDSWPSTIPGFARGFLAALAATSICYPLDTIRRQMQLEANMHLSTVLTRTLQSEGVLGLYRGFLPNAIKNLPNKSVRYGVFGAVKEALSTSEMAYREEVAKMKGGKRSKAR